MRITTHMARRLVGMALLGALAGCAGDDGVVPLDPTQEGLPGAWRATEFSIADQADPTVRLDLVVLGGSMTLSITPSGAFAGTAVVPGVLYDQPGFVTIPLTGLVRPIDAHKMRIDFVPEVPPFFIAFAPAFTLDERTLTFVDPDTRFDFDGDGLTEPATTTASLTRN